MGLEEIISTQSKKIEELNEQVRFLMNLVDKQSALCERLSKENEELKRFVLQAQGKQTRKTSFNSDLPPSKDLTSVKRTQSLRKKTNRSTGGQPGHPGSTLKQFEKVDIYQDFYADSCDLCGQSLTEFSQVLDSKRQEIDIPPIQPLITEYRVYQCSCPCGHSQKANYPVGVNAPIQYGPSVQSWIAYLSTFQYLPFRRLTDLLKTGFNLPISEGSIKNLLIRLEETSLPFVEEIRQAILKSENVGSDETSTKVNGDKHWIWTWVTNQLTYLVCAPSRSQAVVQTYFPDGFPDSILSTDQLAAQLNTPAKSHQICWAHILRKLKYTKQVEPNKWVEEMQIFYNRIYRLKQNNPQRKQSDTSAKKYETILNELLYRKLDESEFPESVKLQKSLRKNRDALLVFLYYESVQDNNNASERALRNVKVKTKVSGQFKSLQHNFCSIRSIIDTFIKNQINVLEGLTQLAHKQKITFSDFDIQL